MSGPAVLFDVAAGPVVGMGHLSRCRVYARALAGLGVATHLIADGMDEGEAGAPFAPFDPARRYGAVVVDRYDAAPQEIAALRARHGVAVVIDDHASRPVAADIVVNGNFYGDSLDYGGYGAEEVLAGPDFAPVGESFVALRDVAPAPHQALATFGLSRLAAELGPLARRIAPRFPAMRFDIVIPPALRDGAPTPVNVALRAPAPLVELLRQAGIVVCGLGVTWQEVIAAGRKAVGVRLVDNQDLMLAAVAKAGLPVAEAPRAEAILEALARLEATPQAVWRAAQARLDGGGPARIAAAIRRRLAAS